MGISDGTRVKPEWLHRTTPFVQVQLRAHCCWVSDECGCCSLSKTETPVRCFFVSMGHSSSVPGPSLHLNSASSKLEMARSLRCTGWAHLGLPVAKLFFLRTSLSQTSEHVHSNGFDMRLSVERELSGANVPFWMHLILLLYRDLFCFVLLFMYWFKEWWNLFYFI